MTPVVMWDGSLFLSFWRRSFWFWFGKNQLELVLGTSLNGVNHK
jgi:hypothetical protein